MAFALLLLPLLLALLFMIFLERLLFNASLSRHSQHLQELALLLLLLLSPLLRLCCWQQEDTSGASGPYKKDGRISM